ncbi:MAG: hypothetical protein LBE38_01765, partial [Deltaproteobacteria bacterium]|nr:hypothetical protein [Deltaproteobacteria bacterium]
MVQAHLQLVYTNLIALFTQYQDHLGHKHAKLSVTAYDIYSLLKPKGNIQIDPVFAQFLEEVIKLLQGRMELNVNLSDQEQNRNKLKGYSANASIFLKRVTVTLQQTELMEQLERAEKTADPFEFYDEILHVSKSLFHIYYKRFASTDFFSPQMSFPAAPEPLATPPVQPMTAPQQVGPGQPMFQPQQVGPGQPMAPPQPRAPGQPMFQPQQVAPGQPMAPPQPRAQGQPMAPPQPRAPGQPMFQPQQVAPGQPMFQPQQGAPGQPLAPPQPRAPGQPMFQPQQVGPGQPMAPPQQGAPGQPMAPPQPRAPGQPMAPPQQGAPGQPTAQPQPRAPG